MGAIRYQVAEARGQRHLEHDVPVDLRAVRLCTSKRPGRTGKFGGQLHQDGRADWWRLAGYLPSWSSLSVRSSTMMPRFCAHARWHTT